MRRPERRVWRRSLAWLGGTALVAGLLVLLFAAYQVWGTGLQERMAQAELRSEYEQATISATTVPPVGEARTLPTIAPATTTTVAPPALGDPVGVLRIPRLGLDKVVVHGAGTAELQQGPGHYPSTPLPGRAGNVAIAGHRTTYGAPFRHLDDLTAGDEIILATLDGELRYLVSDTVIVSPDAVEVLAPAGDDRLTLTTCDPPGSARRRMVVTALLDGESLTEPVAPVEPVGSSAPPRQITRFDRPDPPPATATFPAATVFEDVDGSPLAWPVVWPALLAALLAAGVWIAMRSTHRWWLVVPGAAPVAVALLLFFERLSAALPTQG